MPSFVVYLAQWIVAFILGQWDWDSAELNQSFKNPGSDSLVLMAPLHNLPSAISQWSESKSWKKNASNKIYYFIIWLNIEEVITLLRIDKKLIILMNKFSIIH